MIAVAGAKAWFADGHGLDSGNVAVPAAGEHAAGSVTGLAPATTLVLQNAPPASVHVGDLVTIIVRETNTGNDALHAVNVTGGGYCASFTGGATTLAVGAFDGMSVAFS